MKSILLVSLTALLAGVILVGPVRNSSGRPDRDQAVSAGDRPAVNIMPADPGSGLSTEHYSASPAALDPESEFFTKNIIISLL
jgi:hypothetical protein